MEDKNLRQWMSRRGSKDGRGGGGGGFGGSARVPSDEEQMKKSTK